MSTFQDCSAAAQYAALGRVEARPTTAPMPQKPMSGLEALGRYVGSADVSPRSHAVACHSDEREQMVA